MGEVCGWMDLWEWAQIVHADFVSQVIHPKGGSQQSHQEDGRQFASWLYFLNADTEGPLAE